MPRRKQKYGSFLAAFLRGLRASDPPGLPMQATSTFLASGLDVMQNGPRASQQACHGNMTDLVEQLPDDGLEALQQVCNQYSQGV